MAPADTQWNVCANEIESGSNLFAERWRKATPRLGYVASDIGREITRRTELVLRPPHAERLIFSSAL